MPRTILKPKKVLIVPLSLFIIFNKDVAGEKFANLHGTSVGANRLWKNWRGGCAHCGWNYKCFVGCQIC